MVVAFPWLLSTVVINVLYKFIAIIAINLYSTLITTVLNNHGKATTMHNSSYTKKSKLCITGYNFKF